MPSEWHNYRHWSRPAEGPCEMSRARPFKGGVVSSTKATATSDTHHSPLLEDLLAGGAPAPCLALPQMRRLGFPDAHCLALLSVRWGETADLIGYSCEN